MGGPRGRRSAKAASSTLPSICEDDDESGTAMACKSTKTASKQHGHRHSSRREVAIEARGDDGHKPQSRSRGASLECRDAPKKAKEISYWSSLSVHVAIAAMEAKGSQKVATIAANAVLDYGDKKHQASLAKLASKVSVAVLEAGGSDAVAAAVAIAVMNGKDGAMEEAAKSSYHAKKESSSKTNGREERTNKDRPRQANGRSQKSTAPIRIISDDERQMDGIEVEITRNASNVKDASVTASIISKERRLIEQEKKIAQMARMLDEKEKRLNERTASAPRSTEAPSVKSQNSKRSKGHPAINDDKSLASSRILEKSERNTDGLSLISRTSKHSSTSRSISSKLRKLKEKEEAVALKNTALEDAAKIQRQKETEISDKMAQVAQMEKEINDRLAAIDNVEAVLQRKLGDAHQEQKMKDEFERKQRALEEEAIAKWAQTIQPRQHTEGTRRTSSRVCGSYSTNSSDSTSIVTNRTGDVSRRMGLKSPLSSLTEDTFLLKSGLYCDYANGQNKAVQNPVLPPATEKDPVSGNAVPANGTVSPQKHASRSVHRPPRGTQQTIKESPSLEASKESSSKSSLSKRRKAFWMRYMKSSGKNEC